MSWFSVASWGAWAAVVAIAAIIRGRPYVFFVAVLLGLETLIANGLASATGRLFPVFAYLQGAVMLQFATLAVPRMRPLVYRALVSLPASWFLAATLLAFPWAIARALGFEPWGVFVPYVIAFFGLVDSFAFRRANVDIVLAPPSDTELVRAVKRPGGDARPLRIVQITDPHLGPFMSTARLARICERAVAERPDLVLLTGDFLTMESQNDHALLGRALAPLKALEGRCFACLGNHDHEAPAHVRKGLAAAGITLLVDEATRVDTEAGSVELLGFDFRFRDRQKASRRGRSTPSARRRGDAHRAPPRSRCVSSLAGGHGRSRAVGAHARRAARALVARSAAHDRLGALEDPRSRPLAARSRSALRPPRHRALRVSASARGAAGRERALGASDGRRLTRERACYFIRDAQRQACIHRSVPPALGPGRAAAREGAHRRLPRVARGAARRAHRRRKERDRSARRRVALESRRSSSI